MFTSPCLTRILFPSLFTIFLVIHPIIGHDTQALISKICRQTSDYAFCSNVFYKYLPSGTTDIIGLTEITVSQSFEAAISIQTFVGGLVSSEKNKTLQDQYKICVNSYGIILEQFEEAVNALPRRDYKNVALYESRTEKPVDDCQNNVKSSPELAEKNRQMKVLINMALITVNLIAK